MAAVIKVHEAVINRITMRDAEKKIAALQKSGKLDAALHEITAVAKFAQNALANTAPEVKDNALNSQERKMVARALLKHIAAQFGYQPEDLR